MAKMSPEALRILTLELLPSILDRSGDALEKALGAAMEPVGQGMAAIDSVHVIDLGGGAGDGASACEPCVAEAVPCSTAPLQVARAPAWSTLRAWVPTWRVRRRWHWRTVWRCKD